MCVYYGQGNISRLTIKQSNNIKFNGLLLTYCSSSNQYYHGFTFKFWYWRFVRNYTTETKLFMSKRCELTGVSPLKGHNVSHANNKTKRRFLPNLKKVTFKSDKLKKNVTLKVTNSAVRSVDFKGGLDQYLKSVKKQKLSRKAQKLKISLNTLA